MWIYDEKIVIAAGGPSEPGAPCHGIIGILVNPALSRMMLDVGRLERID